MTKENKLVAGRLRKKDGFWHTEVSFYDSRNKKNTRSQTTKMRINCKTEKEERENEKKAYVLLQNFREYWTKRLHDPRKAEEILFTDYME